MASRHKDHLKTDLSPMSTLLQAANDVSLKNKSRLFFLLTILLTSIATLGILYECVNCFDTVGMIPGFIFVVLVLLLFAQVVGMVYFQRNVVEPLVDISSATRLMADGHLETLNHLRRSDEVGYLAENINDLAINTQEVLLYVWNHSRESSELLDCIAGQLNAPHGGEKPLAGIKKNISSMDRNNEDLKSIVLSFSYFEIKLEHEKMVSDYQQEIERANE
ncbi:MAG: HAMP domain-containing protein [Candidatus Electrothrix sp. AR4]|nr:HAMP domain-containing protein [Candidatus Electrothrix sp. AR4]